MQKNTFSRRAFLASTARVAHGSALVLSMPMILTACERAREAQISGAEFQTLTEEEAKELAAMAARIIPSDGTPGATEAGVVYFIDHVLGDNREEELVFIRDGLRDLQTAGAVAYSAPYFHVMEPGQQDQVLSNMENTAFFLTVRYLTVAGMFALPEYGSREGQLGHEVIGFEDRHAWAPPFGFYDADHAARGE